VRLFAALRYPRLPLKLPDAAHIVPVTFPDSTDEVTNGLGLCRLHHGAYDNGLLGV
jgi:putative restriction endonuclease